MFILAENDEILNITHYRGINIGTHQNKYRLEAYLNKTGGFRGIDLEVIATFDNKEEALNAISDLVLAINEGKPLWDANEYKGKS